MKLGDVVVVLGKVDTRVRDKLQGEMLLGTLEQFLSEEQVSVILPDGDLWVGKKREVQLHEEENKELVNELD